MSTKEVQEWLCLRGFAVAIDGVEGPATRAAISQFKHQMLIIEDGLGESTLSALRSPMYDALKPIERPPTYSLAEQVTRYAKQHLEQHPREVGGQNRGPWVRLYMKGNEGKDWPWCAGFVSFVIEQAVKSLGVISPLPYNFGCDPIADVAKAKGLMRTGRPQSGWLFLVRGSGGYQHIGIVSQEVGLSAFRTIEGNTNDDGSPEGYEVCSRIRQTSNYDFIQL